MAFDIKTAIPVQKNLDTPIVQREQTRVNPFLPGEEKLERQMKERIDPVQTLREEIETPFDFSTLKQSGKSLLKPIVVTGKLSSAIMGRVLSSTGGILRGIQKPGTSLEEIGKMGLEGLTGKKQFRALDFLRASGVPSGIATAGELGLEIAIPIKSFNKIGKLFRGPIRRASDVKLLKIGESLIKTSDEAVSIIKKPLNKAYQPINKFPVEANKILDDIVKLPKVIVDDLQENLGPLDDFLQNFNIEKARALKATLGDFRPTAFGKVIKGAEELAVDKKINRAYGTIKEAMKKAIPNQKQAQRLSDADEAFSQTINAARFVRRTINEPTLKLPTKAGRAASKLSQEPDISLRSALNTLRKANFSIKKNIDKAVDSLEEFNRIQKFKKFGSSLGRSAIIGGVGGAAAGKVLRPLFGKDSSSASGSGGNIIP